MKKLKGVIVPLITPFTDEGSIDKESIKKLVNHVVAGGVHGIFTCSTTGEFPYLSPEQKLEITKTVIESANNRVVIYAGITGDSIEETISNLKEIEQLKPDGIVIVPLVYHSNRKLPQHIERAAKIANLPIILYNNDELIKPPLKRENIRVAILKRISKLDNVIGMKDSSGDIDRLKNYLRAVRKRKNFAILQGNERQIVDSLKIGANGAVPSLANLFPELCVRLYNLFHYDLNKCIEIQKQIVEIGNTIYINRKKIRGGLKAALKMKGIIKTNKTLDPSQTLSPEEISSVEKALKSAIAETRDDF